MNNNIKRIRQSLEMTQEQFARRLNVTITTISRWENGKYNPSRLALEKIKQIQNGKV